MIPYLAFLAPVLLAIWRISDGGWYRLPGSTAIGWCLPAVLLALAIHPFAAIMGVPISFALIRGYEDWNSEYEMLLRAVPYLTLGPLAACLAVAGVDFAYPGLWALSSILPVLAAIATPWVRSQLTGHTSNRTAEGIEGAFAGLAILLLAL